MNMTTQQVLIDEMHTFAGSIPALAKLTNRTVDQLRNYKRGLTAIPDADIWKFTELHDALQATHGHVEELAVNLFGGE